MFVLDTNVLSELRKGNKTNLSVSAWAKNTDLNLMYISVISIMEIRIGILRIAKKDKYQAECLTNWLNNKLLPSFHGRTLDITLGIAEKCANIHVPDLRPERDALIAATALEYGMIVATRNTKDFESTGAILFNPWQYKY